MAARSELPAGASVATDTDVRRLVERGEFPADALAILDACQPSAGPPIPDSINALISTTEQVLMAVGCTVPAVPNLRAA
jgi:hypothetical protein